MHARVRASAAMVASGLAMVVVAGTRRGCRLVRRVGARFIRSMPMLACWIGGCDPGSADRPVSPPRGSPPDPAAVVAAYRGPAPLNLMSEGALATVESQRRLRKILRRLAEGPGFALGHEDAMAYGVGWTGDEDRSDVKSVCGSHPAVVGWDLFRIENGATHNGDGVPFELVRRRASELHRQGGINTMSWHMDNPVTGGDAWDTTRAVARLLPGGSHHEVLRVYLDRAADFLQSMRGPRGEIVPVILRPFHEHDGHWFWWGAPHASDAEFIALWRFAVGYLRKTRGLSHLLIAFSPTATGLREERDYLFRYPGDEYVDVFGLDCYYGADPSPLIVALEIAVRAAEAHGKVAALTEFGHRSGGGNPLTPSRHWLSRSFFEPMVASPTASRIAYALAWRNADRSHFFLPYPGHRAAPDLRRVCSEPRLLLLPDLSDLGVNGSGVNGAAPGAEPSP